MVLPKETIATGAARFCMSCKKTPLDAVYFSPAGFYIGTFCDCGPFSRESEYYKTQSEAEKALVSGDYGR